MVDVRAPRIADAPEVEIMKWHVEVGQRVAVGEPLVEVESEKAAITIEAEVAGTVSEIFAAENDSVPVASVIARIRQGG